MEIEIIAEIAQGYEGNEKLAELLVKGALVAKADSVKLQLVYAEELCVPEYQYFDLFQSLEMKDEVWAKLVQMIHNAGKRIYVDVYGDRSVELAHQLKVDGVKISTTDFYNFPLIKKVFSKFENIFISTGGVIVSDIENLVNSYHGSQKLTLMHGFQAEPTLVEDNNLRRIETLRNRFPGVNIGFMDHSVGNDDSSFYLPMIAIGSGASCIEKHISLDYSLEIEDYISALSIDRFSAFTEAIRKMEKALGSNELVLNPKEIEYKKRAGKVVVAKKGIANGTKITEDDVCLKRVATVPTETHYSRIDEVVGQVTNSAYLENQPIDKTSF